ncbi:hypothetical protein [Peptoniphilus vaginalis]|uniref:hypothetical protein n=1 Tax=Peptoniphilus vaginalis TaxID=1756987 RepID=UPI0023F76FCF|nr:hypothetical protein [Peptoniphilus vaginalis]
MAYRVVSGFQDLETKVFYDLHEIIDDKNKNLKKYLEVGVVVSDGEENIVDDEENIVDDEENIVDDEKTNTKEDVKSKDNKKK